jgi:hypothetical protein
MSWTDILGAFVILCVVVGAAGAAIGWFFNHPTHGTTTGQVQDDVYRQERAKCERNPGHVLIRAQGLYCVQGWAE